MTSHAHGPTAGARTGRGGISDDKQRLCFALALWNERDPILKERLYVLTNSEANHGEDVCDVGREAGTMVSPDYAVGDSNKFTGEIDVVQIDIGKDNHDHLIDPKDIVNLAMMRQ